MKISAIIITFNEERNITRAIGSLGCCDEVLVVDSGSRDRTVELATVMGARVIESAWLGYAQQKNFAAGQAHHDWILSLDADEALSEPLQSEIRALKEGGPLADGYTMPRLAQYCGRWIFHSGWYPDSKVRLYRRERASWVGEYVHESVVVRGKVGGLRCRILHYTCDSLSEHLKSLDRYTTLAAREIAAKGTAIPYHRLLLSPVWTLIRTYFFQRGFLDGAEGLSIAWLAALYTYLKHAKARDMRTPK